MPLTLPLAPGGPMWGSWRSFPKKTTRCLSVGENYSGISLLIASGGPECERCLSLPGKNTGYQRPGCLLNLPCRIHLPSSVSLRRWGEAGDPQAHKKTVSPWMCISGGASLMLSVSPDAVRGTPFHLGLVGRKNILGLSSFAVSWSRNAGPKHQPLLDGGTPDTLPLCYASNSGVPNQLAFLTPFRLLFIVPFLGFWFCSQKGAKERWIYTNMYTKVPPLLKLTIFLSCRVSKIIEHPDPLNYTMCMSTQKP